MLLNGACPPARLILRHLRQLVKADEVFVESVTAHKKSNVQVDDHINETHYHSRVDPASETALGTSCFHLEETHVVFWGSWELRTNVRPLRTGR